MTELQLVAADFPTSEKFDALMRAHAHVDDLTVHLNGPPERRVFGTASTLEYADTNDVQQNRGFRAGRHWVFTSESGAILRWDVDAVPDSEISDTPRWLILSTEARFDPRLNHHTPEDVWALLPHGQKVRGLTLDLQFEKAAARWRARGKTLRIGPGLLAGHGPSFENVNVVNYGALGVENFGPYIQGALGMYDRNLIARLDPDRYVFDDGLADEACAHITYCNVDGYIDGGTPDAQVTTRFIAGSTGERSPGQWQQHLRAFAYLRDNGSTAHGLNRVQADCIYQCLRGKVERSKTRGLSVGYYGDSYSTRNVEIGACQYLDCRYHGVHLALSPTDLARGPEECSHEGYVIRPDNVITSQGANVKLDTLGPPTSKRYIRNIQVGAGFTLEPGRAEGVTRIGAAPVTPSAPKPTKGKRGCLLALSPF